MPTEQPIPHPFRPGEHVPSAQVLEGDRSPMAAGIAEHVVGQRITHVEFTRSLDEQTSDELGVPSTRLT